MALRECARRWAPTLALLFLALPPLAACQPPQERFREHLQRAEEYREESKLDESALELRNALQLRPESAEVNYRLGRVYADRGERKEALFYYGEAHRLAPERSDAALALAGMLRSEDTERAQELVAEVLEREPENGFAYVVRAEIELHARDAEAALAAARKAVELEPEDPDPHWMLGRVHRARMRLERRQQGEPREATVEATLRAFDRVLELGGREFPAWSTHLERAEVLAAAPGRGDEARGAYERVLEAAAEAPEGPPPEAARAVLRYAGGTGDAELRERALEQLVEARPDAIGAWIALARLREEQRGVDAARAVYERLLERRPEDTEAHTAFARYRFAREEPEAATAYLEERAREDAEALEVPVLLDELVRLHYEMGRKEAAVAVLERMEREHPDSDETDRARARRAVAEGRLREARELLRELAERTESAGVQRALARTELRLANLPAALSAVERALELSTGFDAVALRLRARILHDQGEYSRALGDLLRLRRRENVALRPAEVVMLARCRYERGRPDLGRQLLEVLLRGEEVSINAALEYARREGDSPARQERVRKALEAAFERSPGHPELLARLVELDLREGERDRAHARIDRALELEDSSARALLLKVRLLREEGRGEEALALAERAFEAKPGPRVAQVLASLHREDGHLEEALAVMERTDRASELGPRTRALLGRLRLEAGDREGARRAFAAAIEAGGERVPGAKNDLAFLLAEEGEELDRALRLAQEAAQALDGSAQAADTLGYAYLRKGLHAPALEQLRYALELADAKGLPSARIHYHRGLALEGLDRKQEALEAYSQALELDGDLAGAAEARRRLEAAAGTDGRSATSS